MSTIEIRADGAHCSSCGVSIEANVLGLTDPDGPIIRLPIRWRLVRSLWSRKRYRGERTAAEAPGGPVQWYQRVRCPRCGEELTPPA